MEPFPPSSAALAEPNGLLAVGGDLSAERLIAAYCRGIFPWFSEDDPILWWTPNPRAVLFPSEFHMSRSLRRDLRKGVCSLATNQAFESVIRACAAPRARESGTWISPDMMAAYTQLHRMGYAHSIEVYQQEQLIGGLYGVAMGRVFFGESMFSKRPNASKTALAALALLGREGHIDLIDCQVESDHLSSLGARNVSREVFENHLAQAIKSPMTSAHNQLSEDTLANPEAFPGPVGASVWEQLPSSTTELLLRWSR